MDDGAVDEALDHGDEILDAPVIDANDVLGDLRRLRTRVGLELLRGHCLVSRALGLLLLQLPHSRHPRVVQEGMEKRPGRRQVLWVLRKG